MELALWILAAIIIPVLIIELVAWSPKICDHLLKSAVARLPEQLQERFAEEWEAHLSQVLGPFSRLWCAIQLQFAARGIVVSYRPAAVAKSAAKPRITVTSVTAAEGARQALTKLAVDVLMQTYMRTRELGSAGRFVTMIAIGVGAASAMTGVIWAMRFVERYFS